VTRAAFKRTEGILMTELLSLRTMTRAVGRRLAQGAALALLAGASLTTTGCGNSEGCDDLSYYCKFCPTGSALQTECADLVTAAGKDPLQSQKADEACAKKLDDFVEACPIPTDAEAETGGEVSDTGETGGA
jgi:hypothetical protein